MTGRIAAITCAAVGLALAAPAAGQGAAPVTVFPVTGKWRGSITHWTDSKYRWHHFSRATSRTLALSFFVTGAGSKRMILFDTSMWFPCIGKGVHFRVDPDVSGFGPEVIKISRKGYFGGLATTMIDVPFSLPKDNLSGRTGFAVTMKGRFTSSRTVRGELTFAVYGCNNGPYLAWSASRPKPRPPARPTQPGQRTPREPTPTWGVNEYGIVYGCRLIWCSYNLPPPGAIPLDIPLS